MIRKFFLVGALTGACVALLSLIWIFGYPYPDAAGYLCPSINLVFTTSFHSVGWIFCVIILSNTLLYALPFGICGIIVKLVRDRRSPN